MEDFINALCTWSLNTGNSDVDTETEWNELSQTYLKLRYLKENGGIDLNTLKYFLESIDHKTQLYLRNIKWKCNEDPELDEECRRIEENFERSLNINDPIEKLNTLIIAYSILIPVLEDIRNEPATQILDPNFIYNLNRRCF